MLQFLAPFFLAGLVSLGIPILLHLRKKKPQETVPFAAVMFLEKMELPLENKRQIKDLLLLLLRLLALALLVLAFARPFLARRAPASASDRGVAKMILLDTSASLRDGRFDAAKKAAEKIIAETDPAGRLAVVAFDQTLHPVLTFDRWQSLPEGERLPAARAALQSLSAGWFATDLGNSITHATDFFTDGEKKFTPGRLYVISDFQKGGDLATLRGFVYPPQLQIVPVFIGSPGWTNAGVHILAPGAESKPKGPRARVTNAEGSKNSRFDLAWQSQPPAAITVAPGETATFSGSAAQRGQVRLTGDDFAFDNEAWFVDETLRSVSVDFIGQQDPNDPTETLFFLTKALDEGPGYKIATGASTGRRALTVIDGGAAPDKWAAAAETLRQGGNTLLVLREGQTPGVLEALTGTSAPVAEAVVEDYALFGEIAFDDAVFAPFADQRFADFSKIHTWKYRKLDAATLPGARVIARFDTGDPALLRVPVGKGTLFVLTTSWARKDSQLALSSKFAPLLHSILSQSGLLAPRPPSLTIGAPVPVPAEVSTTIEKPDGTKAEVENGVFTATDIPGIYQTSDGKFSFAVNPAPAESEVTPLVLTDLSALGLPLEPVTDSELKKARKELQAVSEQEQKIWWWLILATVMILIAETVLARYQRPGSPAT